MTKTETVKNYIINNINSGKWQKGSKIFSENQIMEYTDASRGTVRNAIKELIRQGVLESRQGSGSFVRTGDTVKDHIIIFTREKDIKYEITDSFRFVFNKIREYTEQAGYIPIGYVDSSLLSAEEIISESIKEKTAGVISIFSQDRYTDFFRKRSIPCVSTCQITAGVTPAVLLDYMDFFFRLKNIISKYNLNNILIFARKQNLSKISYTNRDSFFLYSIEKYFERYDMHSVPYTQDYTINSKHVSNVLASLRTVPDAVIFTDDTIYKSCYKLFPKFDGIMSKTKIITHFSHAGTEEDTPYRPCKIVFDLDTLAKKTVSLLLSLINGEKVTDTNIFIKTLTENEDIFIK